jgi:hypothetical protein
MEGRFLDVNDAYCESTGYSRKQFLDMCIRDIDADESQEQAVQRLRHIKQEGNAVFTTRHRRKDGSIFDVEVSATYVGGERECCVCFSRDISRLKETEQRLEEERRRTRLLLDPAVGPAVLCDAAGKIIDFNDAAARELALSSVPGETELAAAAERLRHSGVKTGRCPSWQRISLSGENEGSGAVLFFLKS